MKEVHFRIIELPTHQVLLTKYSERGENVTPLIVITLFLNGIEMNIELKYADKRKRDKTFREFTKKKAQLILDKIEAVLTNT